MSKMLVRDEKCNKYIIDSENVLHGYWFNNDHSFDCFFNDIEDYYEWKEYCKKDDDTYRVLDEYVQSKGKEFDGFPCEEAAPINEIEEIMDFNYHWNSYSDKVTKMSDVCDLAWFLTSSDNINAIETYYFTRWNSEYEYNQQVYVDIIDPDVDIADYEDEEDIERIELD